MAESDDSGETWSAWVTTSHDQKTLEAWIIYTSYRTGWGILSGFIYHLTVQWIQTKSGKGTQIDGIKIQSL